MPSTLCAEFHTVIRRWCGMNIIIYCYYQIGVDAPHMEYYSCETTLWGGRGSVTPAFFLSAFGCLSSVNTHVGSRECCVDRGWKIPCLAAAWVADSINHEQFTLNLILIISNLLSQNPPTPASLAPFQNLHQKMSSQPISFVSVGFLALTGMVLPSQPSCFSCSLQHSA